MSEPAPHNTGRPSARMVGFAAVALCVVGIAGGIMALISLDSEDMVGAGACLIASALSFGMLLIAALRQ